MNVQEEAKKLKAASPVLAASSNEMRNNALLAIAKALEEKKEQIFAENQKDLTEAIANRLDDSIMKRLRFDEHKLEDVTKGLEQLSTLPDPLGKKLLSRELDKDLTLYRITCPIGVIGVIFEARPDALVQIASLCIKSGNCAILKGGKETKYTNKILFEIIHKAVISAGLPTDCLLQVEQHNEIDELLSCEGYVDLLIPRGSNSFVQYIMEHTKIPVMGHADGVCHIYVDEKADLEKAIPILLDAKTQYTAACNAVETILVQRSISQVFLLDLANAFWEAGIKLRGTAEVSQIIPCEIMAENDFHQEYLSLTVSLKLVDDVKEAVTHINTYGSHHTDCILTEDQATADYFMQMVDSAGVYQNCSTRFADGFRYGFGAEVGISTSKLHARGPVGLEGLVTYKYKLFGHGNIVGDYASGKKQFHFKDLD